MQDAKQFDWVVFYREVADKLLTYKGNREALISDIRRIFQRAELNLPTLERDNAIVDIDPFTFFGLFNKTSMRPANRLKIVEAVKEILSIDAPVPASFDSVPVLNPQNATFYYFVGNRGERDIDELWDFFEAALRYADNPAPANKEDLSHLFDLVIHKKGNGNSKITMALYWIAPDTYLNLDSRSEWYIYSSGQIPAEVVQSLPTVEDKISAAAYFEIAEGLRAYLQSDASELKNFRELSYAAWVLSQQVNDEKKADKLRLQQSPKGAVMADDGAETVHYWIYSPGDGSANWDEFYNAGIMALGWGDIGDLRKFASKEEMRQKIKECYNLNNSGTHTALATWQFVHEMEPGDIVFAKKGLHLIVGRGVVESDYEFDTTRNYYKNIRQVRWTHKGKWEHPGSAITKILTDITPYTDYVKKLNALFAPEETDDGAEPEIPYPVYSADSFLSDVYMSREDYETLAGLLRRKKNVILQGAPGVGKTYAARKLAYSLMGAEIPERVMMVQFHQSYSYEDFIMGFRPSETGFELRKGVFYHFCKTAEADRANDYFFIIDEINRGNLSKIFGELFMLIENDKRDIPLQLLYSNEKFSVPGNVYIIGTMNTADRSLAMLDYALRRRFSFFDMGAGFDTEGFRAYQAGLGSVKFDRLIACVKSLNQAIAADEALGEGFCIGHSYFCGLKPAEVTDQTLREIVNYELIPLLREYWFDEPSNVQGWSSRLRDAIQ
ncbi:MAG: AAA family ATPase [Oscillospiraceae bacterium]|nr:AAA family ATPase [Oscillospiraceae bacterium]